MDDMSYEEYEKLCELQQAKNEKYLEIFESDLRKAGLTQKTIRRHLDNVDLYINEYLLREEPFEMGMGCGTRIASFMGDFFMRKCAWSTPDTVKTTAASIKKFYKSMAQHGHVPQEEFDFLADIIKDEMESWQKECAKYNDSIDDWSADWFD